MFAMTRKTPVSPVVCMMHQWLEVFTPNRTGAIECTSLVTRIADKLDVLSYATIDYLPGNRVYLNEEHFIQGHILRRASRQSLVMIYRGYITKVPLPAPEHWLYRTRSLSFPLQIHEPARMSIGRITRSMARV